MSAGWSATKNMSQCCVLTPSGKKRDLTVFAFSLFKSSYIIFFRVCVFERVHHSVFKEACFYTTDPPAGAGGLHSWSPRLLPPRRTSPLWRGCRRSTSRRAKFTSLCPPSPPCSQGSTAPRNGRWILTPESAGRTRWWAGRQRKTRSSTLQSDSLLRLFRDVISSHLSAPTPYRTWCSPSPPKKTPSPSLRKTVSKDSQSASNAYRHWWNNSSLVNRSIWTEPGSGAVLFLTLRSSSLSAGPFAAGKTIIEQDGEQVQPVQTGTERKRSLQGEL